MCTSGYLKRSEDIYLLSVMNTNKNRDSPLYEDRRLVTSLDVFLGFEKAKYLLLIGGGCLIIVFIFGVILCRLDISAGKSKNSLEYFIWLISCSF